MKINNIVVEYVVEDVEATIAFYQQLLNFKLEVFEKENDHMYWAKLVKENFQISFKDAKKINGEYSFIKNVPIGGSITLVLQVDDIHETYAIIQQKCELLNHPHLTACGATEFSVKDPNGYFITFEVPQ